MSLSVKHLLKLRLVHIGEFLQTFKQNKQILNSKLRNKDFPKNKIIYDLIGI